MKAQGEICGRRRINEVLVGKSEILTKETIFALCLPLSLQFNQYLTTTDFLMSSSFPILPLAFSNLFSERKKKKQVEPSFTNYNPNDMLHHFEVQLWSYLNVYFKYNCLELYVA